MAYTTINKSTDHFITHLYSGNDSTNNQTSLGMTPDLVWVKSRNTGSPTQHYWVDKVRGDKKYISSNATTAEQTDGNTFDLVSGGFNLAGGNGWTNVSGRTYCAWNWKANGQGSSNTDGSINTTYTSVNTTAGFSISKYTGTGSNASIGHGLSAIPHMAIFKRTDTSGFNWFVYHRSLGAGQFSILDTTGAAQSSTSIWQNTTPTSSLITLGGDGGVNASGGTYICYAFAEKKGYSKISSYSGNGSNDGSFIFTGFKPAFVMIKSTDTEGWYIIDNKRTGFNEANYALIAQDTSAEETGTNRINFLSNGFKATTSNSAVNTSGQTYFYMAFAEHPLVSSNGIPAVAR